MGSLIAAGIAGIVGAERWNHSRIYQENRKHIRYIRLLPHVDIIQDGAKIARMVEHLAGYKRTELERIKKGREWYRFLIYKGIDGKIAFYFAFPEDRQTGVKRSLSSLYPEAEIHDIPHSEIPLPTQMRTENSFSGSFIFREKGDKQGFPLHPFDAKNDYWPDVLASMEAGEKESEVWLDLVFSPTSNKELKRAVERASKSISLIEKSDFGSLKEFGSEVMREFVSNGPPRKPQKPVRTNNNRDLSVDEQERLKALRRRYTGREDAFHVSLSVHVEASIAAGIAQTVGTNLASMMAFDNGVRLVKQKKRKVADLAPMPSKHQVMLWTGQELSNILHLPPGTHRIYKHIPHLARGQRSLKDHELNDGVSIGNLQHPLQEGRSVSIPYEQFTKHFVLTGMTGSGKSSTATMMIQALIDQWIENPDKAPGFSYFDPARETVATILTRLLKAELDGAHIPWEKVHYAYLGPTEYPIGLNLLHHNKSESNSVVVKEILGLLKYAYAGDTPRMDRLVENALHTLLEDCRQHTIMGIVPVLTDPDFRNRILPNVKDPIIKQFWSRKIDDAGIDPILNRLSPLITDTSMRRMFGQKKWSVNLKEVMDDGHIYLWDLLNVSKANVKLAAGHLAMQYHNTAKNRSSGSRLHVLQYDEAHLVQVPILDKIIAEDRKFGLSLGLITQYINQFESWLVDAITENVGTVLTCTQGPKSAAAISTMTAGSFDKEYLQKLPERIVAVYTKTKQEGRSEVTTFTVTSDPPYMYKPNGEIADHTNADEIKQAINWSLKKGRELQARDGTVASQVDQEIEEYLNYKTALKYENDEDRDVFYEV